EAPFGFAGFDARGLRFRWLRAWKGQHDVGVFGPIGIASQQRGRGTGAVLLRAALLSLRERGYGRALIPAVAGKELIAYYARETGGQIAELIAPPPRPRVVVLASGEGSNFGALLEASRSGALPIELSGLVVNKPGAGVMARGLEAGVPTHLVAWDRSKQNREAFDASVIEAVAATEPDLVLLLGWMHVLPEAFVERFPESLNLHPAYLPLDAGADSVTFPDGTTRQVYRGARAVDEALEAGAGWIGASVHRLGPAVDRGEVFSRRPLRLMPGEARDALMGRLHALEHEVVKSAVRRWIWEQP
ncbi:MAG TPA: formyltransferase family protein, partial [Candidatus Baltobacteraceae bacterium]|nr:formyltransferase family protein [Candidatus Baltobacteraceae bacterium]